MVYMVSYIIIIFIIIIKSSVIDIREAALVCFEELSFG